MFIYDHILLVMAYKLKSKIVCLSESQWEILYLIFVVLCSKLHALMENVQVYWTSTMLHGPGCNLGEW